MSELIADNAQNDLIPGTDEYNAQMAERFNNPKAPDSDAPDSVPINPLPEGGQEKFYNAETGAYDWESHAKELQFNADGRPKQKEASDDEEVEKLEVKKPDESDDDSALDIVAKAGLDPATLEAKLRDNGDLEPGDYEALTKVGIPEQIARSYVENLQYRIQGERKAAFDYVGGEENWTKMSTWAAENMNETEVEGINRMLDGPDWRLAMDAINSRMGPTASQTEPNLIQGDQVITNAAIGYRSKSEMKADMSSPQYSQDAAFRQSVMQKMQNATWDLDQLNTME